MEYNLNGELLQIEIIRKPNKNLYMRMKNSKTITVTCNKWIRESEIKKILDKNKKGLEKMLQAKQKEEAKDIFFQYLGKSYTRIFDGYTKDGTIIGDNIIIKDEKSLEKFYKKECIRIFEREVNSLLPYFKNIPKFTLKIRNMKTRWGVNNLGSHTITLNSELLKKDLDLLDYVIIHELCHFYEANHSSNFWAHVEKYYPNYKEARKRLKE